MERADQASVVELLALADDVFRTGQSLHGRMMKLCAEHAIDSDIVRRYGPLSCGIQAGAAIALYLAEQQPLSLPLQVKERFREMCQRWGDGCRREILANKQVRQRLGRNSTPEERPELWETEHKSCLRALGESLKDANGVAFPLFLLSGETLGDQVEELPIYARGRRIVSPWRGLHLACRFLDDLEQDGSSLHLRYALLPRIRSTGPDLQSLARYGELATGLPDIGVPCIRVRLRHLRLTALAAVCERRYPPSELARALKEGQDPIGRVAALLAEQSDEDFRASEGKDAAAYQRQRRKAEAVLTLIPMGVDAESVRVLAQEEFGADLGASELTRIRAWLLGEAFPELERYLRDEAHERVGAGTQVPTEQLRAAFPDSQQLSHAFLRFAERERLKRLIPESTPGDQRWRNRLSRGLGEKHYRALADESVIHPSGRVVGKAYWTLARASTFLDLADDVLKRVLFAVTAAGCRVVAVGEEEFLVHFRPNAQVEIKEVVRELLGDVPMSDEIEHIGAGTFSQ